MIALVGGLIALVLGIVGIVVWWCAFLEILMGVIPVMLILGGALATYLGIEAMKDKKAAGSFDTGKDELKREVDTIKEQLKDLKDKTSSQP
jgi:hypothetical protein